MAKRKQTWERAARKRKALRVKKIRERRQNQSAAPAEAKPSDSPKTQGS